MAAGLLVPMCWKTARRLMPQQEEWLAEFPGTMGVPAAVGSVPTAAALPLCGSNHRSCIHGRPAQVPPGHHYVFVCSSTSDGTAGVGSGAVRGDRPWQLSRGDEVHGLWSSTTTSGCSPSPDCTNRRPVPRSSCLRIRRRRRSATQAPRGAGRGRSGRRKRHGGQNTTPARVRRCPPDHRERTRLRTRLV